MLGKIMLAAALMLLPTPSIAQENLGQNEIIVTAGRRQADDFDASVPAIGLRRRADFAVQEVTITGDTRDPAARHDEMFRMIRGAIDLARAKGVQLATGDVVVEPLTLDNYRNLTFTNDIRPDSQKVSFLVKTPLNDGVDAKAALERIDAYVKAVPAVGRALMETTNDLTLSVVKPDQYREQIVSLVADDARAMAQHFGTDYGVEATGVERPVEWSRAGLTDVFLYIPYKITVVPKRP
jgi:hypothetical protein